MNAIELLKTDHDRVQALFEKFKKNEDGNNTALFKQIRGELETHTHIEETIFYPFALKRGDKELKKIIREGLEEHAQVKDLLASLSTMTARNKQFNPKLKVVVENVEHHVEEEEDEMFPMAEDQFSDRQLDKLGAEMEAEKTRFQKKHGIKPAPEVKGAMESIMEKTKEFVGELLGGSTAPAARGRKSTTSNRRSGAKSNGKGKGSSKTGAAKTSRSKKPSGSTSSKKNSSRASVGR